MTLNHLYTDCFNWKRSYSWRSLYEGGWMGVGGESQGTWIGNNDTDHASCAITKISNLYTVSSEYD